jgi:hypothetical protein
LLFDKGAVRHVKRLDRFVTQQQLLAEFCLPTMGQDVDRLFQTVVVLLLLFGFGFEAHLGHRDIPHIGQDCPPLRSARLRKSWQSRRAVLFGAFALPRFDFRETPMTGAGGAAELHGLGESVIADVSVDPHVTDVAEPPPDLTNGQI